MVSLEESEGAPLATSPAQLIDGAVDFVMATRLEAFAAPPVCGTGTWPETILRPVVGSIASPAVTVLLWAVEGEVELQLTSEAELPILILLGSSGHLVLLSSLPRFSGQRWSMAFWFIL